MTFQVDDVEFPVDHDCLSPIASIPKEYKVQILPIQNMIPRITTDIISRAHPVILVDSFIYDRYNTLLPFDKIPTFLIESKEQNKNLDSVLDIMHFFNKHKVTKGSTVYVIGGGITQDLGAFACAIYKRGIPWVFVPTTLLSQTDSCIGGKTALNIGANKNLLGLFSAPSEVIICPYFLDTLPMNAIYSGLGEAFRLSITGGYELFKMFDRHARYVIKETDFVALERIISYALSVKKSIIEYDEFETNVRKVMNYGHTIGHALEAATRYEIPHGIAVTIGIMVETELSTRLKQCPSNHQDMIIELGCALVPEQKTNMLRTITADMLVPFILQDKKAVGSIIKMPMFYGFGEMHIDDVEFNEATMIELRQAWNYVLCRLGVPE